MVDSSIGKIDNINILPFKNVTKYPYNCKRWNYPYDEKNITSNLREWNLRVCEDRVNGTCYNATHRWTNYSCPRTFATVFEHNNWFKLTFKPGWQSYQRYITDISSGLPISGFLVRTNTGWTWRQIQAVITIFTLLISTYVINANSTGLWRQWHDYYHQWDWSVQCQYFIVIYTRDLSGYVKDSSSGIPLGGFYVRTKTQVRTRSTNSNGSQF